MEETSCVFCRLQKEPIIENEHCYAIFDNFPVTPGHMLIIPKRHFAYYFGMTYEENLSVFKLLEKAKDLLVKEHEDITGFNVGVNVGKDAGQSVFHCHIHLIPRRKGDHKNPRGGIRDVIPGKGNY